MKYSSNDSINENDNDSNDNSNGNVCNKYLSNIKH
jgi:hypothetical protein